MTNLHTNAEQGALIELTDNQKNPGLADPNDFKIGSPLQSNSYATPGHGQRGENEREYDALLAEADLGGRQPRGEPRPERNQVPDRRLSDE